MSTFIYKAKNASGQETGGERDARDKFELYKTLKAEGLELLSEREKKSGRAHFELHLGGGVKTEDKINFARNLGLMLRAGLSLARAISVLERQTAKKNLKKILADLGEKIATGTTFADSLAAYPRVFPPIFVSMVHAGEQSGSLSESLASVAAQMESSHNLTKRIRGAMIYPAVIFCVMIVIGILMMIFVVPTLLSTFQSLGAPLPPTTMFVLNLSNVFQHYGLWILAGLVVLAIGWWQWSKKPSGKRFMHMLLLKSPIIGSLAHEVNAARTARTLSSLLHSGVDVVQSVSITKDVIQNVYFKDVLSSAEEAIKKGEPMSKIFAANDRLYPVFFAEMLAVGEETGKVSDLLLNVASYYEDDVSEKTKDMSTIIEPVMIVIIGAAVGFFAVSMITPMYSLVNAIQ